MANDNNQNHSSVATTTTTNTPTTTPATTNGDPSNDIKLASLSCCDLNTKFNNKCQTDWSKSNLISIVSPDGIYILKPQFDIQRGPFQINLIPNPKEIFKHQQCCNIGPPLDTILHKLDNHQYMEMFMSPAMMTHVENRSLEYHPRRFRLAKWSPLIDIYPRQCLLAAITIDYQLLIYSQTNRSWYKCADLSLEFDKLWTQLNQPAPASSQINADFSDIRRVLNELSFVNVCWKEAIRNGPFLLAATITGDIVVWQVDISADGIDYEGSDQHLDVKTILRTNLNNITAMEVCDNLVLLATREGQAMLYDLTSIFNEFELSDSNKQGGDCSQNDTCMERTLLIITIPPTVLLWDADGVEITGIYISQISIESFRIVMAKSTNICWSTVNYIKGANGAASTIIVDNSFSAIDGKDPAVSLHQSPATFVKSSGQNKAVLIADDGSFYQLEFNEQRAESSPDLTAMRTEHLDLSRMMPRGLCTSPNGHLIAMISCINMMYEQAKIHAPTKVVLVPWLNDKTFYVDTVDKLLDENWLAKEKISSPVDVCDRVDYLRSVYPLLTFQHFLELYKKLETIAKNATRPKNNAQLARLKIVAFLLLKLLEQSNAKMIEDEQKIDLHTTIYKVIELYNKELILRTIFSEMAQKQQQLHRTNSSKCTSRVGNKTAVKDQSPKRWKDGNLSPQQCKSLRNIRKWLATVEKAGNVQIASNASILKEEFKDELLMFEAIEDEIESETCPICKADVPFELARFGTCKNRHRLDRCTRSLLTIDIHMSTDLVCDHCKRHYMTTTVWPRSNQWLCEFCQ